VVYVDSDPVVVSHASALLATKPGIYALEGDLTEPDQVLAHPVVQEAYAAIKRPAVTASAKCKTAARITHAGLAQSIASCTTGGRGTLVRFGEVAFECVDARLGRQQRARVRDHHRIAVYVHHLGIRVHRTGGLMDRRVVGKPAPRSRNCSTPLPPPSGTAAAMKSRFARAIAGIPGFTRSSSGPVPVDGEIVPSRRASNRRQRAGCSAVVVSHPSRRAAFRSILNAAPAASVCPEEIRDRNTIFSVRLIEIFTGRTVVSPAGQELRHRLRDHTRGTTCARGPCRVAEPGPGCALGPELVATRARPPPL